MPTRKISVTLLTATALTVSIVGFSAGMLTPSRAAGTDPTTPLGVAETLNSLVQPRFFKFDDERFGMSRIAVARRRHPVERFAPESDEEKERFTSLVESKRDYMVLF